jgi:hypothetical protein
MKYSMLQKINYAVQFQPIHFRIAMRHEHYCTILFCYALCRLASKLDVLYMGVYNPTDQVTYILVVFLYVFLFRFIVLFPHGA